MRVHIATHSLSPLTRRATRSLLFTHSPAEPLVVYIAEEVSLVDGAVAVPGAVRLTPAVLAALTCRRRTVALLARRLAGVIVVHRLGHHTENTGTARGEQPESRGTVGHYRVEEGHGSERKGTEEGKGRDGSISSH